MNERMIADHAWLLGAGWADATPEGVSSAFATLPVPNIYPYVRDDGDESLVTLEAFCHGCGTDVTLDVRVNGTLQTELLMLRDASRDEVLRLMAGLKIERTNE